MAGCADQVKRITLELGGKSANVVFADADIEKAAGPAPYGVFDNAGQDCCARSRILVERTVFDRFMERFEPAVKGGRREGSARRVERDGTAHLRVASRAGRGFRPRVRTGCVQGLGPTGPGFWYPPTVSAPIDPSTGHSVRRYSVRLSQSYRSRTRPTRSGSPTTPPTDSRDRSGPGTWAGRSASHARSKPGTCR